MRGRLRTAAETLWRWLVAPGDKNMPGWVYVMQLLWAVGLLAIFVAYVHGHDRLDLPHSFGSVPVEAPWLGAVGGLLASFGGIVRYNHGDWNPRFNYWHPIKPLMGAATGAVACLLVIVLARTATGSASIRIDSAALDGAAFVFGYAESAFRTLITAITDIFLRPGTTSKGPRGNQASPAAAAASPGAAAAPSSVAAASAAGSQAPPNAV